MFDSAGCPPDLGASPSWLDVREFIWSTAYARSLEGPHAVVRRHLASSWHDAANAGSRTRLQGSGGLQPPPPKSVGARASL